MATAPAPAAGGGAGDSVGAAECTASGWAVGDLLILGVCAGDFGAGLQTKALESKLLKPASRATREAVKA